MSTDDQLLTELVAGHFLPGPSQEVGLAVSGGSDSLALLYLMHAASQDSALRLRVITVDHGLRPESRAEAEGVGRHAQALGLPHEIVTWTGWDGQGNLQDQARRARHGLIADWAQRHGITQVALGHTADDQAETFLMRLARSAGSDGLSGMSLRRRMGALTLVRPMLELRREALRDYLRRRDVAWVDDPSNDDMHYDRVRARAALAALEPLGLTPRAICETTRNLAAVRGTLSWYTYYEAQRCVSFDAGDLVIPLPAFRVLQPEIARRLLQGALMWISGAEYPPRRKALAMALEGLRTGTGMTLHGCNILVGPKKIRICREYAGVRDLDCPPGCHWDGRWQLLGPTRPDLRIRALGEAGLAQCADWRAGGLPYRSLLGYPSVWQGDRLISAPHAALGEGWSFRLLRDGDAFFSTLLAH